MDGDCPHVTSEPCPACSGDRDNKIPIGGRGLETPTPAHVTNPFEMSEDSTVPCEEFDKAAGPGKRCKLDGGTCPFNGNSAKCGERE